MIERHKDPLDIGVMCDVLGVSRAGHYAMSAPKHSRPASTDASRRAHCSWGRSAGRNVELAWVDQGYTGERPADAAAGHGIKLEVVKLPEAKRGFVLLPRRWVVERSLGWLARFRRLARDYERLAGTLAGLHFLAFVCLMLGRLFR